MEGIKDWKLKLRYGKLTTPYQHYTIIVPVVIEKYIEDFSAQPGIAYAGIKMWATDTEEAANITHWLGEEKGYMVDGNIEIYKTDPEQPPGDSSHAYDVKFTYYKK